MTGSLRILTVGGHGHTLASENLLLSFWTETSESCWRPGRIYSATGVWDWLRCSSLQMIMNTFWKEAVAGRKQVPQSSHRLKYLCSDEETVTSLLMCTQLPILSHLTASLEIVSKTSLSVFARSFSNCNSHTSAADPYNPKKSPLLCWIFENAVTYQCQSLVFTIFSKPECLKVKTDFLLIYCKMYFSGLSIIMMPF